MESFWIPVIACAVGACLWIWFDSGDAKTLSDVELMQMAQQMGALKKAALGNFLSKEKPETIGAGDPRVVITAAGHRLLYTVSHDTPGKYHHHYSASVAPRYDATATGELLVFLWSKLLGLPVDRLALGRSRRLVHHAECALDEVEHLQLVRRPVESPTADWIQAFRSEWSAVRGTLKWAPVNVEIRPVEKTNDMNPGLSPPQMIGLLYEVVCGLDQYKRYGAVTDSAEVRLSLAFCMTLQEYFSKLGMAAAQGPHESGDVWGALAIAVASDLRGAAILVGRLDRRASAEVPVRFPRGICAFIHERISASIANTQNPHPEWVRAADLFLHAATGASQTPNAAAHSPEEHPVFSGGNGDSLETAVVINAANSVAGVQAEYAYLESHCGETRSKWGMQSQRLQEHDGRRFDVMTVVLSGGQSRTFYFDVSRFFGN